MRALVCIVCLCLPSLAAACKPAGLKDLLEAIKTARVSIRPAMTGRGLQLACPGWPAPLVKGLGDLAMAPPQMRSLLEAKAVAEAPAAWMAACPGGLRALTTMAQRAANRKRDHLFTACKLSRLGFASKAEFAQGEGALLLPVPVAHLLTKTRLDAAQRRTIVRALAGIATASERARVKPDPLLAPRFARIEIPEPYEPPKPPPPPKYSGIELRRVNLGAGCGSRRASEMHTLVARIAEACPLPASDETEKVSLQVTVGVDGAAGAAKVLDGDLGAAEHRACVLSRLQAARLAAGKAACTVTLRAVRPR